MKIAFLCGSLEPERDGVGDYTTTIAKELRKQGHSVAAISLNDSFAKELIVYKAPINSSTINILRIPSVWEDKKKFSCAKKYLREFDPDWVSLQFVIYSFQPKGLPIGLGKKLASLAPGKPWHIMFHEVYIGFTSISSLKHKLTGFIQRKIILSIINVLEPKAVSTSNMLYHLILQNIGIKSTILNLFSNIPVARSSAHSPAVLDKILLKDLGSAKWRVIGTFGTIYPEAKLEAIIREQLLLAKVVKQELAFIAFGKNNESGIIEYNRLEALLGSSVKFINIGPQSPENVSYLIQLLDAGISCTPAQHIGKSGVFAAMKLHGIEVIIPKGDLIPEYNEQIVDYNIQLAERPPTTWSVSSISKEFINMLHITGKSHD